MHIDRSHISSVSREENELQVIEEMKNSTPQDRFALITYLRESFYGYSCFTDDMDIFIRIAEENISSMKLALHEFGVPELEDQLRIPIISVDDLFINKSFIGRAKDKADLEELRIFLG